jgi:hypothetical protein
MKLGVTEVLNCPEMSSYHHHMVALYLSVSMFNERMHFNCSYIGASRESFQEVLRGLSYIKALLLNSITFSIQCLSNKFIWQRND